MADMIAVATFPDPGSLPDGCDALFSDGARDGIFSSRAWYETTIAHAMEPGAVPCFAVASRAGRPVAVFPLQRFADGRLECLTTFYTCLHHPLVAPDADAALLRAVGKAFARFCRREAAVRLDGLDPDWPPLAPLLAGMRAGGLVPLRFDHFGNWHEPVGGLSFEAYLAGRPGSLRETVRRRMRKVLNDPRAALENVATPERLEAGIAAYEDIYARSWKEPEPHPQFNPALMRRLAAMGMLRFGLLRWDGQPIAAQFWIFSAGWAAVQKLAHDEAHKPLSPGTVLTAAMIRDLLAEGADELDFGHGDDPYKQLWTSRRRRRIGVLLANPRRPAGLAMILRHAAGRLRRRLKSPA